MTHEELLQALLDAAEGRRIQSDARASLEQQGYVGMMTFITGKGCELLEDETDWRRLE